MPPTKIMIIRHAEKPSEDGTVLIAWAHEAIPDIANRILGSTTACPQQWPGERFDLVWVFNPTGAGGTWTFTQVPQLLLPGDQQEGIVVIVNSAAVQDESRDARFAVLCCCPERILREAVYSMLCLVAKMKR